MYVIGSVYFTGDILVGNRWLELLCWQSMIRSRGMAQYKEKGHFVRKTLSCSWCDGYCRCYGCYANGLRFNFRLADIRLFFFLCFFPWSAQVLP